MYEKYQHQNSWYCWQYLVHRLLLSPFMDCYGLLSCLIQESRIYAVAKFGMRVSEASPGARNTARGQSTNTSPASTNHNPLSLRHQTVTNIATPSWANHHTLLMWCIVNRCALGGKKVWECFCALAPLDLSVRDQGLFDVTSSHLGEQTNTHTPVQVRPPFIEAFRSL